MNFYLQDSFNLQVTLYLADITQKILTEHF